MNNQLDVYDDVAKLERYLNLPPESLKNIPIYARKPAVDAIIKVKEMESKSIFRQGLYYIVLTDLCNQTDFNSKYGDAEGDLRIEWFHMAAIESLGEIDIRNYVAFSKTIGDASLFIFSSFLDVYEWSRKFDYNLSAFKDEYPESLEIRGIEYDYEELEQRVEDFDLKARKLVHLGEVSYKEDIEPLSLAVSQTFKLEKNFSRTNLGCTQVVADAIKPKLGELNLKLEENIKVKVSGYIEPMMTYYLMKKRSKK